MKITSTLLVIAVSALGFATNANAQSSATADAAATLITPISISKTSDMNFGTIASSAVLGTVALDYAGVVTPAGGVTLVAGGTSPASTASFTVTGELTSGFSILVEPTLTLTGTSGTLTVDQIAAETGTTGTLVAGTSIIKVKGTLNIPANTVAGDYTNAGGLIVTVNYN